MEYQLCLTFCGKTFNFSLLQSLDYSVCHWKFEQGLNSETLNILSVFTCSDCNPCFISHDNLATKVLRTLWYHVRNSMCVFCKFHVLDTNNFPIFINKLNLSKTHSIHPSHDLDVEILLVRFLFSQKIKFSAHKCKVENIMLYPFYSYIQ